MRTRSLYILLVTLVLSCGKDKDFQALILIPEATDLLFPENLSQCIDGNILSNSESEVLFRWSPAENTDSYELHIENLVTGTVEVYSAENNELAVILLRGTPYSWFVLSLSEGSTESTKSETYVFYNAGIGTVQYVPFPAIAISPLDQSVINGVSSLSLIWEGNDLDNDIQEYDLYFGTSVDPDIFQSNITTNQVNNITVIANNTYYWKIVTKDNTGNMSSSDIFSFSVEN